MNEIDFLNAVGRVDEHFIIECITYKPPLRITAWIKKISTIVACAAVVLGGIMFIHREVGEIQSRKDTPSVSENNMLDNSDGMGQTENYGDEIHVSESTMLENTKDTEPKNIVSVIPMTVKWDVFDLPGKPAQFILLADEQADAIAYETNSLLYEPQKPGRPRLFL